MKITIRFFLLFTLFVSGYILADEFPTFKLLHNQWTLISLPATPPESSSTLEAILGDDFIEAGGEYNTDWTVSSYNTGTKAYETLSLTDTMEKGRGYWIIQIVGEERPVTLNMPIGSTATAVTESIPLTASSDGADLWNLVGNPFATSLNLAELRLVTDAPSCSDGSCDLNKAQENSLISNKVWIFDGESYKEKGTDDQLDPWGGFFVSALGGSNGYALALSTSGGDEAGVYMGIYDTQGTASSVVLSSDGSKAYVADGDSGLQIVDVSNPEVPKLLSSYEARGSVKSVSLSNDGSKAYLANQGEGDKAGLEIVDISSPAPVLLGSYNEPASSVYSSHIRNIALSRDGSKAYLADGINGLRILDISSPAAPTLLSTYEGLQTVNGVTLSSDGSKAYLADGIHGLRIIDVSNPAVPSELGRYRTLAKASTVTLSNDGSKAYVMENDARGGHGTIVARGRGLLIVDISNPEAPALLGSYDTGRGGRVTLSSDGSKAYVAAGRSLQVVDITNPTGPTLYRSFDFSPDILYGVALSSDDSKAYVAAGSAGLGIIDLTAVSQ